MNVTRSGTETMTSFQATLVNAGYGQLALRDQNGKIAQKWTLGHPKCVIGAHANCNVRCMLPGVADHHLLLVIGARQIYMRALAAGVEREGVAVNELVMSGDQSQFAFHLAGHRFEYSRQNYTTPIAKPFVEEGSSQAAAGPAISGPAQDARPSSGRLRFTFVQALEKNRDRSGAARQASATAETSEVASERPAWVEQIVRDALRPVELRLETIAQPINNLERQLRRQRARLRKQQHARKLSRHAAHEVGVSHTANLIQAQEAIQKMVVDQSVRLESVNERVSDIVSQLASLERIVSAENDQHQEVAKRTSQSGQEIVCLQREMLALVSALQTQIAQPPASGGEDAQWLASIQRQLEELHQSLATLDEIKSSLKLAVSQNRELSQDLEARWQRIEEVAKRPVLIQSIPVAPPEAPHSEASQAQSLQAQSLQAQSLQAQATPAEVAQAQSLVVSPSANSIAPSSETSLAEMSLPEATFTEVLPPDAPPLEIFSPETLSPLPSTALASTNDQPIEFSAGAISMLADDQALLEAAAFESPAGSGDFRIAPIAPSIDPVPLPSWWEQDPVVQNEAYRAIDVPPVDLPPIDLPPADGLVAAAFPPNALPTSNVFADESNYGSGPSAAANLSDSLSGQRSSSIEADFADGTGWHSTEYEQELGSRTPDQPWSYAPPAYSEPKSDYPELDMPQLLTSAIADAPPSKDSPLSYGEQAFGNQTYAEQTFDEQTFGEQTFGAQHDFRDASSAVTQSTSEIEDQLQKWLTDDYAATGRDQSTEGERFRSVEIEPTASERPVMLDQPSMPRTTDAHASPALDEEYAISAFSAERLTIDDASLAIAPEYSSEPALDQSQAPALGQAEEPVSAPYELPYQPAEPNSSESYASPSAHAPAEPANAEGNDESVEEYMRRLLARMRGVSESEVKLPGLDRDESPRPEAKPGTSQAESASGMSSASTDTEPFLASPTEAFNPTQYVPRVSPETNQNIDALRELANTSARSAIHVSARRKHGTAIMIKSGVSLVGLAAGAALVSINGFKVNIGLVATLASFLVAIIWGYDALATLRPLLQASRGARSQLDQPSAVESEEEAR